MKRILAMLLALVMVFSLVACGPSGTQGGNTGDEKDPYTGIAYSTDTQYDYLYSAEMTTWNYLSSAHPDNHKPLSNFVDCLIEVDSMGNLGPCIAESWTTSDDGLKWTFKLRQDVKWYTCDGEEYGNVTANDFVFAAQKVADSVFNSGIASPVLNTVAGAQDFYNGATTDPTTIGVKALDEYTLEYTLLAETPYFLTMLDYGCFQPLNEKFYNEIGAENFGTDRDTILYCGAYLSKSWVPQQENVWVKNEKYWDADKVYIETVYGRYNEQAETIAPEMFLRGEIDSASVSTNILDEWMSGENANVVHPTKQDGWVGTLLFDYDPNRVNFSDDAKEANYIKAVNNKNFRMAIATGIDKDYVLTNFDPYNIGALSWNLMVPSGFVSADGKDYVNYGNLSEVSEGMFDKDAAIKYRDAAVAELTAAGVTLPIELPVYYHTGVGHDQMWLLIEKQLEELLGNDFIEITVYAGPATDFNTAIRRAGVWGMFEGGWSPDYADPATYFEPYEYGSSYGGQEFMTDSAYSTGYIYTQADFDSGLVKDEDMIGKERLTWYAMIEEALAESDLAKRYELFAKAEEYALEEAFFIPLRRRLSNGYEASLLAPFEKADTLSGFSPHHFKGVHMLSKSYSTEEYNTAKAAWEAAKAGK